MADKCIGKLTLDTTGIDAAVKHVNDELKKLGAGVKVDLSKQVAAEVKKQLAAVEAAIKNSVKNIQNAANQATKAFGNIGTNSSGMGSLQSSIKKVTDETTSMGRAVTGTGATVEKVIGQIRTGFDSMGKKVREVSDANGNIIRKIYDEQSAYKNALKVLNEYYTKMAQIHSMDVSGKQNTPQYQKLLSEVDALKEAWKNVELSIRSTVLQTEEAQRATQLYNNTIKAIDAGNSTKEQETALRNLIQLYQEYYKYKAQADTFAQKGDAQNADMYNALAEGIGKYIQSIAALNPALNNQALAEKQVVEATLEYQKTIQSNANKEQEANVKAYADALVTLYNAQTQLNNAVASGKIKEGSAEYQAASDHIKNLEQNVVDAGSKLDQAGIAMANSMNNVRSAIDGVIQSEARLVDASQVSELEKAESAYQRLTTAVKNYNTAKKANNETGMNYWQNEMNGAIATVDAIEKILPSLKLEQSERDAINAKLQESRTLIDAQQKGVVGTSAATGELESQVKGLVTRYLSLMAVIRAINNLIKNMTEYVTEYSDKMNEIQMITLKTDAEVEQLANTYRSLAKEMSVSSLDMADAAIYFTRQGLEAAEIEKRLKNVTMYAKAANVEFKDASEIITAVVNSMGLVEQEAEDGRNAAQRVSDVFLQIGDHAATSGQEIGEAMQKAAASAGAFGVSMEWLASYIATVSETTRQEARTIGTAFNTIIARLHQIKSTGYNQEDETKVNDIAKALSKIDVVLMDQEGEWRDMETILIEVASKWDGLDDKTKSYIATTMAGVKQQNVFLALMNDMAKGAENGSRAFELHSIAMNSDGVAAEKYSVYLDSVTAAQERLTIAQEEFYSILDEDIIKGWYNTLAGIVEWITKATEAMGGLNIVVPLVTGAVALLVVAVGKLAAAATAVGGALTLIGMHPVIATIAAVTVAIGALTAAGSLLGDQTERMAKSFENATNAIANSQEKLKQYSQLQSDLIDSFAMYGDSADELNEKLAKTSQNQEEYNQLLDDLASISPIAKQVVEQLKSGFIDQKEAASLLNQELERLIQNEETLSMHNLLSRYANYQSNEKNTRDVAILAKGWEEGNYSDIEDPEKRFRNILATTYGTGNLSKELTERIKQAISDYIDSGMSVDDAWDMLATDILYEMFDSFEVPEDMTKRLAEEVMQEVDYVMSVVGKDLDPANYAAIRESLISALFGDDGQLDTKEYANFSKVIAQWVRDIARNGPDSILSELSDVNIAESLTKTLFDPAYFGDLFKNKGEEFSRDFIDAYNKFIKEGFSSDEIATILTGMSQEAWDSAARVYKEQLERAIKEELGIDFLGANSYDENGNVIGTASLMWDDLSLKTLETIHEMVQNGSVDLNTINGLMIKADGDAQKFAESLKNYAKEVGFFIEEVDDWVEPPKGFTDLIKDVKSGIKDIQAIDAAIKDIQENGDDFNYGDMFELAETHKELLTVIDDNGKLLEMLQKIREETSTKQRESFRSAILGTSGSEYGDFATLEDYRKTLTGEDLEAFDAEVEALVDKWQKVNENAKQVEKELEEEAKQAKNALEEAQKAFKENLSEVETLDSTIAKLQDSKQIDFSNIINLASTHPEIMNFVQDTDTLLAALERLKAAAKEQTKASLKEVLLNDSDFYQNSIYYDPRYNNLKEYMDSIRTMKDEWDMVNADAEAIAGNMVEGADATSSSAETWLDAQMKIAEVQDEVNWAKANNFEDQIKQLQAANERGGIQEAMTLFNSWDDKMQQAVGTTYPKLVSQFAKASKAIENQAGEVADLTKETEELGSALKTVNKLNDVKYFKDAAKATKDLSEGTISVTDAYEEFNKEINKVSKAYKEIQQVRQKEAYNAKEVNKDNPKDITTNDVQTLADLLNTTAEEVLADFPGAVEMFDELTGSAGELMDVLAMLNREAFIKITGVSEADFSNLENGLFAIRADAEDVIKALEATGQWEVSDPIDLPQSAQVWDPFNNKWISSNAVAKATVLKPTGNNPFKRQSNINGYKDTTTKNGRTGGGGGSSKDKNDSFRDKNTTTEVEKMLDLMSQVNAIQQYQQNYYQSQNKYYSTTGQLQGVIAYMQKEKEVLEGQNGTLESNIRRIEEYMNAKQAELATLSTEDEKYKEVADDFDKLQKAHQNYTKQLIDNKSAVESLNQAMEEQRKKIRQMEIDLRNLILGAIEDREKKRTDMLNAEIEMENTIFDLIVKRYEKERDEIIRTTELKIEALQSERDLLEENLRIRKEQAETEDKAAKLRELEVKYQRILADPTRAKEARQLKTEIDDLRKEMAWDLAEEEVKSQQDSIDQQIESLEDYKEYIENYYADLFEHPQQLIAEMREIMMGTQEEIINWLKQNDDAYRESSENTQLAMVTGWEETYNNMKGILKTYWDEVEEIIAQGDDYIIEFLKNNSADYAAAGKLQAEAYVDEWKKQLEDLHKAHQTVAAEIAGSYATIQQYNGNGSGNSSSDGGSSKGGGTSKTTTTTANMTVSAGGSHYYEFTAFGKNYSADKNSSGQYFANRGEAYSAAEQKIDALYQSQKATLDKNGANAYGYNQLAQAYKTAKNSIRSYKTGGIADYTGPAWVDGSPQDPERILTPYQNKLFESFVKTLEKMATISIPSMPNFGALETTGANPVSVGDIIVNVDNLDTDDDYEEMADRVCEILTERIGRTAVVGGLRIRST